MSEAGPSKRKRGPKQKPRGDPTGQEQPQWYGKRRKILYEEREVIPVTHTTDLGAHTLLQFKLGSDERNKAAKFIRTNMLQHRNMNWVLLSQMNDFDKLETWISGKWKEVLKCDRPQYGELTIEFLSTFHWNDGSFNEPDAVSFALGRHTHEMSIPQFAVHTGFYTQEEIATPEFLTGLRGAFKGPVRKECCLNASDLANFWSTISTAPFSKAMVGTYIKDPILRYIHKILSCTIIARKSGEDKVTLRDLFCMLCIVEGRTVNFASLLAWSFARGRRGGARAGLDMGPYITRIAESLGVFDRYDRELMTKGPNTIYFGTRELRKAGIWTYTEPPQWEHAIQGPQVHPPEGTDAAEAMHMGLPPRSQRPLHRRELPGQQYARREPAPEPLTLDSLYDSMDYRFGQIQDQMHAGFDDMRTIMEQNQQRNAEALRYMMGNMHMDIPDFFRGADQPPPHQ
ncbi:hypothetical protein QVD17_28883 [Tagetes erecta]|uniref:Uncharacterized protein n=1 Tax=Tagetes erecta TaxID=13708 RepID=A0AAD8KB92_TARER|nr:hypothetical protein QVD17_28883 [Tagetes erecta]